MAFENLVSSKPGNGSQKLIPGLPDSRFAYIPEKNMETYFMRFFYRDIFPGTQLPGTVKIEVYNAFKGHLKLALHVLRL